MQLKITIKYHFKPSRVTLKDMINVGWCIKKLESIIECWWECKMTWQFWEKSLVSPQKVEQLSWDSAIPVLENWKHLHVNTRTQILLALHILKCGNNADIHQLNRYAKYTFIQYKIIQAVKKIIGSAIMWINFENKVKTVAKLYVCMYDSIYMKCPE